MRGAGSKFELVSRSARKRQAIILLPGHQGGRGWLTAQVLEVVWNRNIASTLLKMASYSEEEERQQALRDAHATMQAAANDPEIQQLLHSDPLAAVFGPTSACLLDSWDFLASAIMMGHRVEMQWTRPEMATRN